MPIGSIISSPENRVTKVSHTSDALSEKGREKLTEGMLRKPIGFRP